jgi:ribonuclease P protein component
MGASVVALFSVPRKKFKLAVRRNLIRRRMKEAYRLNKGIVLNSIGSKPIQLRVALLYIATDTCDFFKIQDAIVLALKDMAKRIDSND